MSEQDERRVTAAFEKVLELFPEENKKAHPQIGTWGHLLGHVGELGRALEPRRPQAYYMAGRVAAVAIKLMMELDRGSHE